MYYHSSTALPFRSSFKKPRANTQTNVNHHHHRRHRRRLHHPPHHLHPQSSSFITIIINHYPSSSSIIIIIHHHHPSLSSSIVITSRAELNVMLFTERLESARHRFRDIVRSIVIGIRIYMYDCRSIQNGHLLSVTTSCEANAFWVRVSLPANPIRLTQPSIPRGRWYNQMDQRLTVTYMYSIISRFKM